MSAMVALFYPSRRKVGTEFSQETTASDSDDVHSPVIVIQISVSSFTFTGFFLPHQFSQTIRHRGITYGTQKQDKRTTRVGNAQGSLMIGSSLTDKVTKSQFDQICTCSHKIYISCGER